MYLGGIKLKHKNNDIIPQIFIAVVGVILVGIIIYYTFNSVKSTTRVADTVIANAEDTATDYAEYTISMYEGEEIRGSEVVNLIKKELGDYSVSEIAPLYVEVVTRLSDIIYSHTHINNEYIDEIKNFSSIEYYIKPTALFTGKVIRTENRVIIGLKFTQK